MWVDETDSRGRCGHTLPKTVQMDWNEVKEKTETAGKKKKKQNEEEGAAGRGGVR